MTETAHDELPAAASAPGINEGVGEEDAIPQEGERCNQAYPEIAVPDKRAKTTINGNS